MSFTLSRRGRRRRLPRRGGTRHEQRRRHGGICGHGGGIGSGRPRAARSGWDFSDRGGPPVLLAHVSDTHVDGTQRAANRVEAVVAYLQRLARPVDAVLVTGDLTDHGTVAEYEELAVLLGEPASGAPINQVYRGGGAVFALCDSSIPGRNEGMLADETIEWLVDVLAGTEPQEPVFVGFHHPPVRLHSPFLDELRQYGEHRLAEVVARYPQVVAVLCGHAHTAAATTFAGRPLLVAPGVASTLTFPWEPEEGRDRAAPVAIAFHVLDEERRLTTHYRVVPVSITAA